MILRVKGGCERDSVLCVFNQYLNFEDFPPNVLNRNFHTKAFNIEKTNLFEPYARSIWLKYFLNYFSLISEEKLLNSEKKTEIFRDSQSKHNYFLIYVLNLCECGSSYHGIINLKQMLIVYIVCLYPHFHFQLCLTAKFACLLVY